MSLIRRLFRVDSKPNLDLQAIAEQSDLILMEERQNYRNMIQKVDSGARVMRTWEGVNRMRSRGSEE